MTLTQALSQILIEAESSVELGSIYDRIEDSYPLSVRQKESTRYNEPRFHHEIRAIINDLVQDGKIIRVSRGTYRRTKNS
jgi:hypothetical protein